MEKSLANETILLKCLREEETIIGKPRNPIKLSYEESHKEIDGVLYKKCNHHFEYFPDENDWFQCTDEYFYKNKTSKTDGLCPECKRCTSQRAFNYQHDYWDEWYEAQNKRKKANIEEWRDYHRKHNRVRKDLHDACQERFYQNHPEKHKEYADKHKTKEHNITKNEWESNKKYFDYKCAYCGLPIEEHWITVKGVRKLSDFHKEHVDHYGKGDLSNCVPACRECNSYKWKFEFEDWYNENNPRYTKEKHDRIIKWITKDYKLYIEEKKQHKNK